MHICTIIPQYLPDVGGAELGMHDILRILARTTEHRFSVITTAAKNDHYPETEMLDGIEIYRFIRPRRRVKWLALFINGFMNVGRLITRLNPDVVHISYIMPIGVAAWFSAQRQRLPVVMSLVGKDIIDPFDMPPRFFQKVSAYCIQRTPHVIANSSMIHQQLVTRFHAKPEALVQIPYGVDVEKFHPNHDVQLIRQQYGIQPDQPLILALQRLSPRKGVDVLIEAIRHVVSEFPDVRVLIAGQGPEKEKLVQLTQTLQLENRITFCGFVPEDEKPFYYAAADIFAMHSYFEGLGIVFAEAGASGLPVVTTNVGGIRDVVLPHQTGILVESGKPQKLAEGLRAMLSDRGKSKLMGIAARQHIQAKFALSEVADQYMAVFRRAYHNKHGS